MALGLSIYPQKASKQEIFEYLQMARKYNFEWIFTSLLSITQESTKENDLEFIKKAKELGYKIQVDVSPQVFETLNIKPTDLSYFAKLGIDAIRLDEPFNGEIESIMTYNPYGIDIIINGSNDSYYLDLILNHQADEKRISACHNFYPQAFTGLSRKYFIDTSTKMKARGIKTAAFINSKSGTISSKYALDGCPSLEEHRNKSLITQVRDLKFMKLIDDIYVSTMFVSEKDLEQISACYYQESVITFDITLETKINEIEKKILEELHVYRGDISEYMIRSTQSRIKYQKESMAKNNPQAKLYRGDVVILNDAYGNYAKELHIVLKDFCPNNQKYNLVAKISEEQIVLLDLLEPWSKFKLAIIK